MKSWTKILAETLAPLLLGIDLTLVPEPFYTHLMLQGDDNMTITNDISKQPTKHSNLR
jgi:hypothetical protein